MPRRKRNLSTDTDKSSKKPATAPAVMSQLEADEDSLQSILAQIKAHEESEALARKLQQEWNAPGPSSSRVSIRSIPDRRTPTPEDVIMISDSDHESETDEAMARRLSEQWDAEDAAFNESPPPRSNDSLPYTRQGTVKSDAIVNLPVVLKLEECKDVFIGEKTCSCGAKIPSPRGHVVFTQQSSPPSLLRLLHAPCKSCKTNHCRGCMIPVPCPLTCKGGEDSQCSVDKCCTNVRFIALFEALGGFDRQYLGERETSDQRAREAAAKAQTNQVGSVGPRGTGYGMGHDGTYDSFGFSSAPRRGRARGSGRGNVSGSSVLNALAQHFDEIIVRALNTITSYLPAPYTDSPHMYDILPHQGMDALLSMSQLPNLLGTLLRNDSVTDWIARIDVYHAMLGLLRRMADCELTLEVLTGPRWEMSKSCGLEDWVWNEGQIVWERDKDTDVFVPATPLYVHFKKLTKQCETFLAGASSMLESVEHGDTDEVTEIAVTATSLCHDIIAARDDIERAMIVMGKDPVAVLRGPDVAESGSASSCATSGPSTTTNCRGKGKGKERDPAIDLEREYVLECERLAFKYVTLSQPSMDGVGLDYPNYKYAPELKQTANATRNPKDRLHLVKELAVMATSLPPGVWVRVDEVRNDAIKIVIAGPEGTPYAGGLFEFDCFIPLEYPNKPPLMYLRTTGGGTVRFNPNLYSNGKVCLSLLGTWPGRPEEQWSPKSTLLQVLVSIQSMILIDLPYFNEPGFGKANPSNSASIEYNKDTSMQTTRWAIVDWLKDEHKHSVWGGVIASHFLIRHSAIRKCIQEWAKTQPSILKYQSNSSNYAGLVGFSMPSMLLGSLPSPYSPGSSAHDDLLDSGPDLDQFENWGMPPPPNPTAAPAGYSLRTGKKAAAPLQLKSMDLLHEYDEGIKRVQEWHL